MRFSPAAIALSLSFAMISSASIGGRADDEAGRNGQSSAGELPQVCSLATGEGDVGAGELPEPEHGG